MTPGVLVQFAIEDASVESLLEDVFVEIEGNELLYTAENTE